MSAEPPTSLDQVRDQGIQLTTGVATALVAILNVIVRDLDAEGITSKDRLADRLERAAREAQQARAPERGTTDLMLSRRLAKALRAPPQASAGGVWDAASAGSDAAHNNVPPTIIVNKIIFAGV